jgi:hypothetical protein
MGMASMTDRIISTVSSEAGEPGVVIGLARIIHEHFCCIRRVYLSNP